MIDVLIDAPSCLTESCVIEKRQGYKTFRRKNVQKRFSGE